MLTYFLVTEGITYCNLVPQKQPPKQSTFTFWLQILKMRLQKEYGIL
jgi:hypothetical protein